MKRLLQFFVVWLFILILNALSYGQTTDKNKIAVIDLKNRDAMSQEESITLTDLLRSMLVQTNAFTIVTREQIEPVLRELSLQQSGCTSTECAAEIGKMLETNQIVTGSIGKLGSLYTINIDFIDVTTARIIRSFPKKYKGEIEGLYDLMEQIANEIRDITHPRPPDEPDVGALLIITEPRSATVFLDGLEAGETPLKKDNILSGQHKIKIILEGYEPIEGKTTIEKRKVTKYDLKLKAVFSLVINSIPSDAEVYINGEYAGTTPYYRTVKDGTSLNLSVKKKKYKDWMENITVVEETEITAKLKGKGKTWLWFGTLAIAGGGVYYYMFNENKDHSTEKAGFPSPPGRP